MLLLSILSLLQVIRLASLCVDIVFQVLPQPNGLQIALIAIEGIFIVVYIPAILARFHKLLNWRLRINTYTIWIISLNLILDVALVITKIANNDIPVPFYEFFSQSLGNLMEVNPIYPWIAFECLDCLFLICIWMMISQEKKWLPNTYTQIDEQSEFPLENLSGPQLGNGQEGRDHWMNSNIFSQFVFSWVTPLVQLGARKPLEFSDSFPLLQEDTVEQASVNLYENWMKEVEKTELINQTITDPTKKKIPSMKLAFVKTYIFDYFVKIGTIRLVKTFFILVTSVFVLPLLLNFIQQKDEGESNVYYGVSLVLLLTFCTFMQSVSHHQFFFVAYRMGIRIRASYMTLVYSKALKLRNTKLPIGEIVNMVSTDSQKVLEGSMTSHHVWASSLEALSIIIFLYIKIGVSCIPGIAIVMLFFPFQGLVGRTIAKFRRATMKAVDFRVRLMTEVLFSIKLVKLYAWEEYFVKSVSEARSKELTQLRRLSFLKVINLLGGVSIPIIAAVSSFITYYLLGNTFDAPTVFSALSLFHLLRMPMSVFPNGVKCMAEILVSLDRLQKILLLPEVEVEIKREADIESRVELKEASFSWDSFNDQSFTLQDINLTLTPGKIVAIVGSIGAGKSSLLSALLNEMDKLSGSVKISGTIAYAPQQPWIINMTLRDNILFGAPFNEEFYEFCLECCDLKQDIESFPGKDLTEIGEKGINLSGGQKQRVSLARAIYSQSQIYLMDDPLGAVDTHVGKHLFDNAIGGLKRLNKSILLVTHQLQYLQDVDQILVMKDGKIVESGSYTELINQKGEFYELEKSTTQLTQEEDEDEDDTNEKKKIPLSTSPSQLFKTMTKEDKGSGSVPFAIYKRYGQEAGGFCIIGLIILVYIGAQATRVGIDSWLSNWVQESNSPTPNIDGNIFISVYVSLTILFVVLLLVGGLVFYQSALTASTRIHNTVFKIVLGTKLSFFDTTPIGRIVNRFSNDMDQIDDALADALENSLYYGSQVMGTIVLVCVIFPYFLVAMIPLGFIYHKVQTYFRKTSRELKRLDSISRSPIYAHLSTTLQGLTTIRSYCIQPRFEEMNQEMLDGNNKIQFTFWAANRWLGFRLDLLALVVVFFSALCSILLPIQASVAGLVLSYVIQLTGQFQWCVRQIVDMESKMTSTERLIHYINNLEPEETNSSIDDPEKEWPTSGNLSFDHYFLRYQPNLPITLHDLHFDVKDKEKIGIVGRTGAGKSSLASALFRTVDSTLGRIFIDGVDISNISLKRLRSSLTIIPQDPVLFIGTIRTNLDPLSLYSDYQIWNALEQVNFHDKVSSLPETLEYPILENGENLSVGERQLLCIARALLRKTKIIIMDEATSSIDLETDSLVQKTMKSSFSDCTVLTIAHRINTIIDSDQILVLDEGHVQEFDSPGALLQNPNSFFSFLVDETGKRTSNYLKSIAFQEHSEIRRD